MVYQSRLKIHIDFKPMIIAYCLEIIHGNFVIPGIQMYRFLSPTKHGSSVTVITNIQQYIPLH
jgi:hypothetical protein